MWMKKVKRRCDLCQGTIGWDEDDCHNPIEEKMGILLADYSNNWLLIDDCIDDLIEHLKMFRDKTFTEANKESNYSKMLGFILQELDLVYIDRTYLSTLDYITHKGLEILNAGE